jgi:hypothetical protein
MVFGSTTSAFSWEAFRQAIEALTKVFTNRLDLVIKHKKYLDMLKLEYADLHSEITPVFFCAINQGIINKNKNHLDLPACIYVNNALMLAVNRAHMETVLAMATKAKAIFVVMGTPKIVVRQLGNVLLPWTSGLSWSLGQGRLCWVLSLIPTCLPLLSHISISKKYLIY